MALAIRLSRGGRKNRPHYSIVVADSRKPRDGRFIEKLGTYNPLLKKDDEARVKLNGERITYWVSQGAQPSERVARFMGKAGLGEMPAQRNRPQKSQPKAKAQERIKEKEEKAAAKVEAAKEAAAEEAKAAAEAPAEAPVETPAEEETTETVEAPAEEPKAEAPAEEPKAEAPAEEPKAEAPAEEAKAEDAEKAS